MDASARPSATIRAVQPRRLSHVTTFAFKYVWPTAWLGLIGTFLVSALLGSSIRWGPAINPFWGKVILGFLFGAGIFMTARLSIPLKRVDELRGSLHISNYVSTDVVPLTNVCAVRVTGDFGHKTMPAVEVSFRQRTRYGSKILFLAQSEDLLERFFAQLTPTVEIRRS
jgi:hypothetical protein